MSRKLVTNSELVEIINSDLSKYESTRECKIRSVMPLKEDDSEGCNWSDDVNINCGSVPKEIWWLKLQQVIQKAQKDYNLE